MNEHELQLYLKRNIGDAIARSKWWEDTRADWIRCQAEVLGLIASVGRQPEDEDAFIGETLKGILEAVQHDRTRHEWTRQIARKALSEIGRSIRDPYDGRA